MLAAQMSKLYRPRVAASLTLLSISFLASHASARRDGLAVEGCAGCHGGGGDRVVTVTIVPSTAEVDLGQTVRLDVTIAAEGVSGGGFYLKSSGPGELAPVAGEPQTLDSGVITHSSPKRADGAQVTFAVDWTAPDVPGDVEFLAFALAGNGNDQPSGDAAGTGYLSLAYGCTPMTFYRDVDMDGIGAADASPRQACAQPEQFARERGDCDDYEATVVPGASERCNQKDDDCDGRVDEDLMDQVLCQDDDGDGYGVLGKATAMGCGSMPGFGLCEHDCDDRDPSVHPDASELCNYKDDDCNNRIDEGARVTCGTGWCRRAADGCNAALCTPGEPEAETCNALDDDCDDQVDEGSGLCPRGQVCANGACAEGAATPSSDASVADAAAPPTQPTRDGGADGGCGIGSAHGGWALQAAWLPSLLALCARRRRALCARRHR